MIKLVLLCGGGMSTSILMRNIQKEALKIDLEIDVSAHSVSVCEEVGADADIIMVGPQVRFMLPNIQKALPDKHVEIIDMKVYGLMNGQAIIERVREIMNI